MMTELERKIIERLRGEGPITFCDFMRSALYDPELGYYNTERAKIGPEGDYYTSSNVHAAFGAVLARVMTGLWQQEDIPLTIVEMGAGTGRLAADLLASIRDSQSEAYERLTYIIVESSPAMRRSQEERLNPFGKQIRWQSLEEIKESPVKAIFFSNELIDAMPVNRVRRVAQADNLPHDAIEEQYVTLDSSGTEPRLALEWGKPSSERLARYLERCGAKLKEGWMAEINLDAINWLRDVSRAMKGGYLITIDYGDTSDHLYSSDRGHGTLRSFHRHRLIESPIERAGEQDITASVNFTALIEYGRDAGFETVSYERQTAFLLGNGLIEIIAGMESATGAIDDIKDRLAIKNLFLPGGVSDNFRVLIQKKG